MPSDTWTRARRLWLSGAMLLSVGCAAAPPPDFRVLRAAPVMSQASVDEASAVDGSALSRFAWECDAYGAYIDELREGRDGGD